MRPPTRSPLPAALLAAWIACCAGGSLRSQEGEAAGSSGDPADAMSGAAETEELRRILLSQPSIRRPEVAEALARLRATGLEAFCPGVLQTADLLAASGEKTQAAFLFERYAWECPRPGSALLALSTLIGSEEVACGPALAVADSTSSPGDEADRYAADIGSAVVHMVCLGEGAPDDRVESMAEHAAGVTFGERAAQARGYVRVRMIVELNRRTGRRKAEREHLLNAAAEACASVPTLEALLVADRSPGARDLPDLRAAATAVSQGAPLPALSAGGLLGELWRGQLLEGLDPGTRACLADLVRALRLPRETGKAPRAASELPQEIDRLLGVRPD